jgi:vitamin B12/bleomycin/antimicrobial peptide transport system ATP-binding/permease protein
MMNGRKALGTGAAFLRRVWSLASPYWRSDQRLIASALLASVVALTLGGVGLSVLHNMWYREFYNALEQRDVESFWRLILYFCGIGATAVVIAVYRVYLAQMLEMRWRTWLTRRYLSAWLSDDVYYRLELENRGTDNPDQRIAEDLRSFTTGTLSLSLGLLSAVVTLGSFVTILWNVGGPLTFTLGESEITIPGFMVWMALVYAVVGTILTHYVGKRLIGINFMQERFEADFRFSLVRLRENAEGVALYRGERSEEAHLRQRFGAIQTNWWELMRYTKRLTTFTASYNQTAVVFPFLVSAPRFFGGELTLGALLQISQAFGRVEDSLSWFINAYARLADWTASVNRLITFHDALERHRADAARDDGVRVTSHAAPSLRAAGLNLSLPNGKTILPDGSFTVEAGDHVLVSGPSGSGKSTLFRAMAGIWPYGQGEVSLPEGASVLFLPQKPYIPIGTLRDAVAYPAVQDTFTDAAICEVLAAVKLDHLPARLDEAQNWSMQLSGGEQQRLAIARALLHHPDWLFLDEATSALDGATEAHVYGLLRERLAGTSIVSIAHRPGVDDFHDALIDLTPTDTGTTLQTKRRVESLVVPAVSPTVV